MRQLIAPIVLLLAVAACGEVKNFTDAAVGDDTQIDADTTPDAVPIGPVTVTATHTCCTATGPASGVDVIVIGPDGTVGETVQTAADGTATVQVTAGDSITTILHEGSQHLLTTHLAVEPGDQLRVGGNYQTAGTARGTMTINWPAYAGASTYYIYGPCSYSLVNSSTLTYAYPFQTDCGTAPFDIVVAAQNATGDYLGWSTLTNQGFSSGSTLAMPPFQNAGGFSVSIAGIPSEVTYVYAELQARLNGGGFTSSRAYAAAPAGGALVGSFAWPTSGIGVVADTRFNRDGNFQTQFSREALPSTATSYNRPSVELLPWVASFTSNFAAGVVTWIQSGEQAYDGAAITLYWYRQAALFGGGNSYRWTVVAPPGVTNLRVPELPAAYAIHGLQDTDTGYGGTVLYDRSDAEGYDGLRAVPTWELECPDCSQGSLDAPPMRWSGQVSD